MHHQRGLRLQVTPLELRHRPRPHPQERRAHEHQSPQRWWRLRGDEPAHQSAKREPHKIKSALAQELAQARLERCHERVGVASARRGVRVAKAWHVRN